MLKTEKSRFFLVLFSVTLLAFLSKLLFVESRPLHNDEGVNHYFINRMYKLGYYPYSHKNYHGPSFFYFLYFLRSVFGDTIQSLRLGAIIPGLLLIPSLLLLANIKSRAYIVVTALLITISATLHYISRYAIHETLFLFFSLIFAFSLINYIYYKNKIYIYLGGVGLAGLITTKETFIITVFSTGLAFITILAIELIKRRRLYYKFESSVFDTLLSHKYHLLYSVLIACCLIVDCYTALFTWMDGIYEFFQSVPQWIGRNTSDKGHFKPALYYTSIFIGPWFAKITDIFGLTQNFYASRWNHHLMEPSFFVILALPIAYVVLYSRKTLFKKDNYFLIFNSVWFFSSLGIYSSLNYKTPWLIINMSLPGVLLFYDILKVLFTNKIIFNSVIFVFLAFSLERSIYYNYFNSYKDNPIAYVHTQDGLLDLVADVKQYYLNKHKKNIAIIGGGYWPLPFYLPSKEYGVAYFRASISQSRIYNYYVIVVKKKNSLYKSLSKDSRWDKEYYEFNESNKFYAFYRKSIS